MECFAGAAAVGAGSAFDYNRENFQYDRKLRLKAEFQLQDFRLTQAKLWREDIRDLISLSEYKMHVYLLVNVLLLGHTVVIWCQGKLPWNTPDWLMAGEAVSTAGALMFLLLSIWMAMHAAVSAQAYETRLLTQLVRLPIPTWQEIEGCRTCGSDFEHVGARQMFRVPWVMGWQEQNVTTADDTRAAQETTSAGGGGVAGQSTTNPEQNPPRPVSSAADPWGIERAGDDIKELGCTMGADVAQMRHVKIARQAMIHWQSYDAFARISMSVGMNQLLLAMSYYILGYVLVEVGTRDAAACGVILLSVLSATLLRLDMSLTTRQLWALQLAQGLGPFASTAAAYWWSENSLSSGRIAEVCGVVAFGAHGIFIAMIMHFACVEPVGENLVLPKAFSSVLYLDVFGWVSEASRPPQQRSGSATGERDEELAAASGGAAGDRPSSQLPGTYSDAGTARAPYRPEDLAPPGVAQDMCGLPGAPAVVGSANPRQNDSCSFFESDGWLGAHAQSSTAEATLASGEDAPRVLPWYIFTVAMRSLCAAWLLAAAYHSYSVWTGWDFQVEARLAQAFADESGSPGGSAALLLQRRSAFAGFSAFGDLGILGGFSSADGSFFQSQVSRRMGLEEVSITWPQPELALQSIACDASGKRFVASDGLFVYSSSLEAQAAPHRLSADFVPVSCPVLEGEGLQDAFIECHGAQAHSCNLVALHRNGRRVSSCAFVGNLTSPMVQASTKFAADVSDKWLERLRGSSPSTSSDVSGHSQFEKVVAITRDATCGDFDGGATQGEACLLLGTTHGRVVQVRQHASHSDPLLVPAEVLSSGRFSADIAPGSVRAFDDRHVAVLQDDGRMIALLDSHGGAGAAVGWLALPEQLVAKSFCVGGGFVYLLSHGFGELDRKVWRFRAPSAAVGPIPG